MTAEITSAAYYRLTALLRAAVFQYAVIFLTDFLKQSGLHPDPVHLSDIKT